MVVFFALSCGMGNSNDDSPEVLFEDDFEYTGSPVDHGWTLEQGTTVSTSSEQAFSGSQSMKLSSGTRISYSFNDSIKGDFEVSVRFYDDLHTGFNWEKICAVYFDKNTKSGQIHAYNSSEEFTSVYLGNYIYERQHCQI